MLGVKSEIVKIGVLIVKSGHSIIDEMK